MCQSWLRMTGAYIRLKGCSCWLTLCGYGRSSAWRRRIQQRCSFIIIFRRNIVSSPSKWKWFSGDCFGRWWRWWAYVHQMWCWLVWRLQRTAVSISHGCVLTSQCQQLHLYQSIIQPIDQSCRLSCNQSLNRLIDWSTERSIHRGIDTEQGLLSPKSENKIRHNFPLTFGLKFPIPHVWTQVPPPQFGLLSSFKRKVLLMV